MRPAMAWVNSLSKTRRPGANGGRLLHSLGLICLAALLCAAGGCRVVQHTTARTRGAFASLTGRSGGQTEASDARSKLQHEVMRAADQYVARVTQATDELTTTLGTAQH